MSCTAINVISFIFLAFGLLLAGVGGYLDMTNSERLETIPISKYHCWNDGIIMILLAIYLVHFNK